MPAASYIFDAERQSLLDGALNCYFGWAGAHLVSVTEGASLVTFWPRSEMLTAWRTLNGGVLNGMVELPSFVALLTALKPDELPVTNDVFVQHMRSLPGDAEYRMEGRLIRRGQRMAWTEVDVMVGERVVSTARITKTIGAKP